MDWGNREWKLKAPWRDLKAFTGLARQSLVLEAYAVNGALGALVGQT